MSTNKHRVLPVTEDLDATVELPSLPSIADSPTDTWVAPHLSSDAETEEFLHPVLPEQAAYAPPVERRAADRSAAIAAEGGAALARVAELERDLATRAEQHRLGEAERDDLRLRLARVQAELGSADKVRDGQSAAHALRLRELELERAEREATLTRLQADLTEMRRRSAAHSEVLQQLEGRRQLFDSQFREREALIDERDARLQSLAAELAAERAANSGVRAETAFARDEAAAAHSQIALQRSRADELAAALLRAQEESAAARAAAESARVEALAARAAAEAAQAQAAAHQARADDLDAALLRAQEESAAARQGHDAALNGIAGLEHDVADRGEAMRALHEQLRAAQLTIESLRGDLAAAEDLLRTQESEQQQRAARIARLEGNESALRARVESAERQAAEHAERRFGERHDSPESKAAELLAITGDFGAPGASGIHARLEGQTRLLVRTEGDTGIVHLLRRTTTIGRTPDNDLCIEEDFISRHHAVVLISATGTVLEDLNSTNGVFVNGVRIARRQLQEGDLVTIGKTEFRYVLKPPSEPPAS